MKPWRETAIPHPDVLEGTFQQSEFAADITAVRNGKATREYQDAPAFFQRTFITEGMRLLLVQVAKRLCSQGGEPVIQLQTAFGGGKTHTMLAVYHLATRTCPLIDLSGVSSIMDQAGMLDVKQAKVAVLDGNAHAPGQSWKYGKQTIKTLWGELAWQLGGEEAFAMVKQSDQSGTSPGKQVLSDLLGRYSPCVILIDELVAYIRQFHDKQQLSGGTFDSNISFLQALTEACKLVPNAVMLASLPESETEAGSNRGISALTSLEKIFARVQAIWKPVATEESFEIVRRRLFEPILDNKNRDAVCQSFIDTYIAEGSKLPGETQESNYRNRLLNAYPIHPEIFDRLYEDWSTLENFQRTRGVLKLMAKVIYRLWKDENRDLMIMPGSLPLYDNETRNELLLNLGPGWDPVIDKDIDGDRSETFELETKETRFGSMNAARKVARTVFLGSAPASVATRPGIRGIDRAKILLGCLQPEQNSSVYTDALNRLADRLHYMSRSAEIGNDTTRFWFDTRANLRREMEDRKKRFKDLNEINGKMAEVVKAITARNLTFDGVHIFTPDSDVPDDSSLRLVILKPQNRYYRDDASHIENIVFEFIRNNGNKPRQRGNRLIFLAADNGAYSRFEDYIKTVLAWQSIVTDVKEDRLNIDQLQKKQAETELANTEKVLPSIARECFKWLLCPAQYSALDQQIVESYQLNTSASSLNSEIERVCLENELIIETWSPIHLRSRMNEFYWKGETTEALAMKFWEDSQRYLYLPRLKNQGTLEKAIKSGAESRDFFGIAYGHNEGKYEGFKFGTTNVQLDNTLLLIKPEKAEEYQKFLEEQEAEAKRKANGSYDKVKPEPGHDNKVGLTNKEGIKPPQPVVLPKAQSFIGTVEIPAATAKLNLVTISEEVISHLASDPNAEVKITLEIQANFPNGIADDKKRAISENATSLKFTNKTWE